MVADYRMEENKEQRRQDLMERLRIRFSQYQKRQTEIWTRFASNGPVKEERERHDTQLYQQRILNTRANSKPRPKQDQAGKISSSEAPYPPPNAMGDTLILQVSLIASLIFPVLGLLCSRFLTHLHCSIEPNV